MAPEHLQRKRKAILLEVEKLIALPIAVQRRLVRHVIQEVKGNLRAIDLHHIESILRLAQAVDGHGRTQSLELTASAPTNGSLSISPAPKPASNGTTVCRWKFPVPC